MSAARLLALCAVLASAAACYTRADCDNHGNCVNGACVCEPGYSPPTCSGSGPHLCQSRADCDNHGNCVNGACVCDAGWTGATCSTAACPHLQCAHGSSPNSHCTACSCVGCWSGANCTSFPSTPPASCSSDLAAVATEGKKHAAGLSSGLPLPPIPGWRSLGMGADALTGSLGDFPVFLLNFSSPSKVWTAPNGSKFLEPDYFSVTDIDPSGTGKPIISCKFHPTVASLYSGSGSTLKGSVSIPLSSPTSVQSTYFSNANTMTLCTAQLPLYQATIPSGTPLSRYATTISYSLPPTYTPSSKGVFDSMFTSIGTNAVQSVTMGGVVVVVFQHGGCLTSAELLNTPVATIESQAETAMTNIMSGTAWSSGLSSTFTAATRLASETRVGGNPEWKLPRWTQSVIDNPVPVSWTFVNLYSLFPSPGSSVLQQAVDAHESSVNGAQAQQVSAATAANTANWKGPQQAYVSMQLSVNEVNLTKSWDGSVTPLTLKAGDSGTAENFEVSPNPLALEPNMYECYRFGEDPVKLSELVAGGCERDGSTGGVVATTISMPDGDQDWHPYIANNILASGGDDDWPGIGNCFHVNKHIKWGKLHDEIRMEANGGTAKSSAQPPVPACANTARTYQVKGHGNPTNFNVHVISRCCVGAKPSADVTSKHVQCTPM